MKVFVLSHTHWDREWFVSAKYTKEWLVELFYELLRAMEEHPSFRFILDGQTLIVEDLISQAPNLKERIKKFVREERLLIGPVYCQIDWRIAPFAAIWKNFEIGKMDMERWGGGMKVGWFMDNFGQVSQLPQVMRHFGVERAAIWRGVGGKGDVAFCWKSPDGSKVLSLFLIAGYRNLYNLRSTPDIAQKRFENEIEKQKPFSDVAVLLDGYDLDLHPEDPTHYLHATVSEDINELFESLKDKAKTEIEGELLSGKFASVFPGTLSTRSYLKVMAGHVGRLLKIRDVLGVLFDQEPDYDTWREYLKALIHDNICGVGVDEIHDRMEDVYRDLHSKLIFQIEKLLSHAGLSGRYVFSIQPCAFSGKVIEDGMVREWDIKGAGLWKERSAHPLRSTDVKSFEKKVGSAVLKFDGKNFFLDGKRIGMIRVERELGDAYSSKTKETSLEESIENVEVFEGNGNFKVEFERRITFKGGAVHTKETVFCDDLPMVRWKVKMKTSGCCFKVRFGMESTGRVFAGMPADVVKRNLRDEDLLPEKLEGPLSRVLLAARETGAVDEFPFQGFVARFDGKSVFAILARGLREYKASEDATFVTLTRSVEWITKPVKGRVGDAGPLIYAFGARAEREVIYDLAFIKREGSPEDEEFLKLCAFFQDWPVLVEMEGSSDKDFPFGFEKIVLGTHGQKILFFEPHSRKVIVEKSPVFERASGQVRILNIFFPVSREGALPDPETVHLLSSIKENLLREKKELSEKLQELEGIDYHRAKHRILSIERATLELDLSILMVKRKLGYPVTDDDIRDVAWKLNQARSARRTYDYILELYKSASELQKSAGN